MSDFNGGFVEFGKIISLLLGLAVIVLAFAILVWIMRFQFTMFLPDLFNTANPIGLLAIAAILVFGGFYLLHAGFETVYNAFRR